MALRSNNRRRGLMAEINVVPYIDVMLVLVVILMVAAPFVNPSLINLPSVNKASKAPEQVIEVIVYPDARLSLRSGKTLTPVDMPTKVANRIIEFKGTLSGLIPTMPLLVFVPVAIAVPPAAESVV